jgi:restriction endonuclease Mrr
MDKRTKDKLKRDINLFNSDSSSLSPVEAERVMSDILSPLLAEDDYVVRRLPAPSDDTFDLIADRSQSSQYQSNSIGVEIKHYHTPLSIRVMSYHIVAGTLEGLNRVMFVSPTGFTSRAKEIAYRYLPLQIELIDIDGLKAWIDRIGIDSDIDRLEVDQILRVISRRFAQLIAENARNLDKLEWRHLEMILAEVFEGLGFSVELTPGSKDEGKDIILECYVSGKKHSYIVEVKHWRSGKRVGQSTVKDFLNVIVRESRQGGLFLSTSGYCDNAFEMLTEIEREKLKFGSEEKVVNLCKTYVKADSGIWSPPELLTEVLFDGTQ